MPAPFDEDKTQCYFFPEEAVADYPAQDVKIDVNGVKLDGSPGCFYSGAAAHRARLGYAVDHTCGNAACLNWRHMKLVSIKDNRRQS